MLRLTTLAGLLGAITLLVAGPAGSSLAPGDYLGEWSADTSSAAPAAGQTFVVADTDEATARTASGDNSTNFDVYCKSTNTGVEPVTYFTVATTASGTFGGCVSGKTGGHIYTWNTGQVWYAHTAAVKGEPLLKGTLVTSGNVEHAFTAHHPAVKFLAHVKLTQILKARTHVVELTTVKGAGEFRILDVPAQCGSSARPPVVSGSGGISVKSVKVGGKGVVELDSLTVKPDTDQSGAGGTFSCDREESLRHVAVAVTKADPAEKDACSAGATGTLWLLDGTDAGGSDGVKLDIPKCHVDLSLTQSKAKKGSHVAVAETIDENGY